MRILATAIIALWMLAGGVAHLLVPEQFYPIVPGWLPKWEVVILSGIAELILGVGVLIPRLRALAGLGFAIMCAVYLPLHVWDFFRPDPVFAVPFAATIRIVVQFVLIGLGWTLWRAPYAR